MIRCLLPILSANLLLSAAPVELDEIDPMQNSLGNDRMIAVIVSARAMEQGIRDSEWHQAQYRKRQDALGRTPDPDTIIVSMGGRGWDVRMAVASVVYGKFDSSEIKVWTSAHYGEPKFKKPEDTWLLIVKDTPDGFEAQRHMPAFTDGRGDWYVCGRRGWDWQAHPTDPPPPTPRPVTFEPPARMTLEAPAEGSAKQDPREDIPRFYPEAFWSADGDEVTCHSGVPASEYADHLQRTEWRRAAVREHCIRSLRHTVDQDPSDDALARERADGLSMTQSRLGIRYNNKAVGACIDRLYPSRWPYTE